jgi:hypothetical protein
MGVHGGVGVGDGVGEGVLVGVGVLKCWTPVVAVAVGPCGGGVGPPPPVNSFRIATASSTVTTPEPSESQVNLLRKTDFMVVPSTGFDAGKRALVTHYERFATTSGKRAGRERG